MIPHLFFTGRPTHADRPDRGTTGHDRHSPDRIRVCQRCTGRSSGTGGGTRLISMRRFWARPSGVVFGASGR
jgi:hypothetical protein